MKLPFSGLSKSQADAGAQAEIRAEQYLRKAGLKPKARNFRGPRGEIDLIMQDADTLVFIEVRLRKHPHFSSATESITRQKQEKIIRTANHYLQQHKLYDKVSCRFDVIAWNSTLQTATPEWIKNAFC